MNRDPSPEPIRSTTDKDLNSAISSQQKKHGVNDGATPILPEKKSEDKQSVPQIVKLAGYAVAVVAAVALGSYAINQKKSRKEKAEESAQGLLGDAQKTLKRGGRWLGDQADSSKQAAGEVAGNVKGAVEGAIPSSVGDKAVAVKEKARITGIKAEREGLKASEKSDAAVREAAASTGEALQEAQAQSAGFFGSLKKWLADR
jgi:type II secretory pathway pseudopilin PulG